MDAQQESDTMRPSVYDPLRFTKLDIELDNKMWYDITLSQITDTLSTVYSVELYPATSSTKGYLKVKRMSP